MSATSTVVGRFPNILAGTNTAIAKKAAASTAKKAVKKKPKPVLIRTQVSRGPRYALTVEYSSDKGQSFGPNLKALPNTTYRVKMEFTQHQAEPLLQGAVFDWILPTGWKFTDGHGRRQNEVCISNPLVIMRLVKSPATVALHKFIKVLCVKVY